MQGLSGDFGTMQLSDLVLYLGNREQTGTLIIERGNVKKTIRIQQGVVISTSSNDSREYLGQFLINFGHITEDDLTRAFQTQSETNVMIGRILVMIGLISEDVLRETLIIKHRETLLGAFRWKEGAFEFLREELPFGIDVSAQVPLLDIHREADFRETAWQAMLQVFPSPRLTLKLDDSKNAAGSKQDSLDVQLFSLIKDGEVIEEICLKLHATDFHLYQRLYALYHQGIVAPAGERAPSDDEPPVGEEACSAAILSRAREFLVNKQFAEAEALAARSIEMDGSLEAHTVFKEAEAGLLGSLRTKLSVPAGVPVLSVPLAKLKELDLSPQEKYLLSRVDGAKQIGNIIRVSPIQELDALKLFMSFVDQGLLKVANHASSQSLHNREP